MVWSMGIVWMKVSLQVIRRMNIINFFMVIGGGHAMVSLGFDKA